ncbi:MAG: ABC transporter permease [Zestosphaera sp.]
MSAAGSNSRRPEGPPGRPSHWRILVGRQVRSARFRVGLMVVITMLTLALLCDIIAPYPAEGAGVAPPDAVSKILLPPSTEHLFGTDGMGRDLFSRVVMGTRSALLQILVVVSVSLVMGLAVGVISAYFRGVVEMVITYLTELFMSIPAIVLALSFAITIGRGLTTVVLSLVVTWWSWYARIAYVYARSIVEMDYVTLSRLSGLNPLKIVWRHVVRNVYPPVAVQAITDMGSVLLEATAINFLSLGVPLNSPEWGVIMYEGKDVLVTAPWVTIFPGLFLLITALGFSLLGDSLREALDPRLRRRWRLWF